MTFHAYLSVILYAAAVVVLLISLILGKNAFFGRKATRSEQPVRYWLGTLLTPAVLALYAFLFSRDAYPFISLLNLALLYVIVTQAYPPMSLRGVDAWGDRVGGGAISWLFLFAWAAILVWMSIDTFSDPRALAKLAS